MPTQAQIERVRAALQDMLDDGESNGLYLARAAILAVRPTPEEHERGIEAAAVAHRASTGDTLAAMRVAIAAYIAATGGGNG